MPWAARNGGGSQHLQRQHRLDRRIREKTCGRPRYPDPSAACQAARLLAPKTLLGDAGYDAEHNHRLCREELGMRRSVIALNPRNTGRRWPKTPYRRATRRRFPRALYHQRWHAESGFSQFKRRLGSALTARSTAAQARELVLRVLAHNLMLLRLPDRGFQQSKTGSQRV